MDVDKKLTVLGHIIDRPIWVGTSTYKKQRHDNSKNAHIGYNQRTDKCTSAHIW